MRVVRMVAVCVLLALTLFAQSPLIPETPAPFVPHPVASSLNGGHQLLASDINRDGKQDLVALGRQMTQVVWFENPFWQRRSMIHGVVGPHSMTAADMDNDGRLEIALAYGFTPQRPETPGAVAYLIPFGDPRGIWMLRNLSRIEKDRRLLWTPVDGELALVDAPDINEIPKLFDDSTDLSVPIKLYRPGIARQESATVQGRDQIRETLISKSGNIVKGTIQTQEFFATMAGDTLVMYQRSAEGPWRATDIDKDLTNGKTLLAVDINSDGIDEIVASRSAPRKVYLYRSADGSGANWQRLLLDDTMGATSCASAELSGDRKTDIACIDGTNPFAVHWYENFTN